MFVTKSPNPFNDPNLAKQFVGKKRWFKGIVAEGAATAKSCRVEEVEKVKRRREEREHERELWKRRMMQGGKEKEMNGNNMEQEENFMQIF